ncbi:MAG: IreB family regulatory phosphoprotein [Oscillospiraceae bacterium]|nr:IreB family regulatory phosphoprotein [Oscillospiraceae bacterium]MBR5070808.1 IreB family regulatory phosphoprotein [Oscillospiraceae bacterium]MBR5979278.1 IreB family regulatory phosphoprotein [Oscillospiraceae bacterium]
MQDATMIFSFEDEEEKLIHDKLVMVFDALKEKGYNPVNQIVGYLLTEDPTYITTNRNARSVMLTMDRDDILQVLVRRFLS